MNVHEVVSLALQVLQLRDRLESEVGVQGYGLGRISGAARGGARDAMGLVVTHAQMPDACVRWSHAGERVLVIRAGLPGVSQDLVEYREWMDLLSDGTAPLTVQVAGALVGALPASAARGGYAQLAPRYRALRRIDPEWRETWYPEHEPLLHAVARAVLLTTMQVEPATRVHFGDEAYVQGAIARQRGDFVRAELWLRHAITAGAEEQDWSSHAYATLGLATTYWARGRIGLAVSYAECALRAAESAGLSDAAGRALHDLAGHAIERGDREGVITYTRRALEAYGPGHPLLSCLATDLATWWLIDGRVRAARRVLLALLEHGRDTGKIRLHQYCALAYAAGALGDEGEFAEAWVGAWRVVSRIPADEGVACHLCTLAEGAVLLGDWRRAEFAATRALEIATARRESKWDLTANAILEQVVRAEFRPAALSEDGVGDDLCDAVVESLTAAPN